MPAQLSQCIQVDEVIGAGQLSLLIFQPDALSSRVAGPVERWLMEQTGCVPVARAWVTRSDEVLRRFYPDVAGAPFWPLVSRAFTWGPCLAVLWRGDDAARALPASKGVTHPARSAELTVRGRFWCDSSLTNLLHVSDTPADAARELEVLRSQQPELFREPLPTEGLAAYQEQGAPVPGHSSIITLCSLLLKHQRARGGAVPPLSLPAGESARRTMERAEDWLKESSLRLREPLAAAVSAYLEGTAQPERLLRALGSVAAVSEWEQLVLEGGVLSRAEWLEARSAARG